jgi:hypothetical protein
MGSFVHLFIIIQTFSFLPQAYTKKKSRFRGTFLECLYRSINNVLLLKSLPVPKEIVIRVKETAVDHLFSFLRDKDNMKWSSIPSWIAYIHKKNI